MGPMSASSILVLSLVWAASAAGTGFLLALLARRVHPSLSLVRLWVFYSALMGFLVGIVFALGWF